MPVDETVECRSLAEESWLEALRERWYQSERAGRDVGEIAWAIPNLVDVQNNVTITSRRRPRNREEAVSNVSARKQA